MGWNCGLSFPFERGEGQRVPSEPESPDIQAASLPLTGSSPPLSRAQSPCLYNGTPSCWGSETSVREERGEQRRLELCWGLRGCTHDPDCSRHQAQPPPSCRPCSADTDKSLDPDGTKHLEAHQTPGQPASQGQADKGEQGIWSPGSRAQLEEAGGGGVDHKAGRAPWWHSTNFV